jgi:hypothetical protein
LDEIGGGVTEKEKECPKGEYDNNGKCTKIKLYFSRNLEPYATGMQGVPLVGNA